MKTNPTTNAPILTREDWAKAGSFSTLTESLPLPVEITAEIYYDFLESLPALSLTNSQALAEFPELNAPVYSGFANSEPQDHDAHGRPRYANFATYDDPTTDSPRYFFYGYHPRKTN